MSPSRSMLPLLLIAISSHVANCDFLEANIPVDGRLNFTELAEKYGYQVETYEVTTEDGYVLTMFRIPGNASRPVFLQHGSYASSDDFLVRTNVSLIAALADAGYDVWAGNLRGNRYSRKHVRLNPDDDVSFWSFGIDEHGLFDLPAMIDFILEKTNQEQVSAIGHSLGTTMFFVMGAAKPEYNDKIKVFIALAPVVFAQDIENPVKSLSLFSPLGTVVAEAFNIHEVGGWTSPSRKTIEVACSQGEISYDICIKDSIFFTSGDDEDEFEPSFLPLLIGHFPAGTSARLLEQFSQLTNTGRFAMYDYGPENVDYYNSPTSPEYDLTQVTMDIALMVGKNDRVATIKNAKAIKDHVPNIIQLTILEPEKWNHVDFTYARQGNKYLYPLIFDVLNKYT